MCLSVPAQVVSVSEDCYGSWAIVEMGGIQKRVSAELVADLVPGEYVLVHTGFILVKIDEEKAKAMLRQIQIDVEIEEALQRVEGLILAS